MFTAVIAVVIIVGVVIHFAKDNVMADSVYSSTVKNTEWVSIGEGIWYQPDSVIKETSRVTSSFGISINNGVKLTYLASIDCQTGITDITWHGIMNRDGRSSEIKVKESDLMTEMSGQISPYIKTKLCGTN